MSDWPEHHASYLKILDTVGLYNTLSLLRHDTTGHPVNIDINGQRIAVRPGTTDRLLVNDIFVQREYNFPQINPAWVRSILDAGANVGYASVYFRAQYPNAEIVALEPELENFLAMMHNTSWMKRFTALRQWLWNKRAKLLVEDLRWTGNWWFQVREDSAWDIDAIGMEEVIRQLWWGIIDICKIDIEGSEVELFSEGTEWLSSVRNLIIELHDRYRKGASREFFNAIYPYNYRYYEKWENILIQFDHEK